MLLWAVGSSLQAPMTVQAANSTAEPTMGSFLTVLTGNRGIKSICLMGQPLRKLVFSFKASSQRGRVVGFPSFPDGGAGEALVAPCLAAPASPCSSLLHIAPCPSWHQQLKLQFSLSGREPWSWPTALHSTGDTAAQTHGSCMCVSS